MAVFEFIRKITSSQRKLAEARQLLDEAREELPTSDRYHITEAILAVIKAQGRVKTAAARTRQRSDGL